MKNTTIVIPAYKSFSLLKECLDRIEKNTDLSDKEVIVVCNGSEMACADLVLRKKFTLVWIPDAIGFTKAANIGFKMVSTPYTVIMNTDSFIENFWPRDAWIQTLTEPLKTGKVGITGASMMWCEWGEYLPFSCCGIASSLFTEIGYLDEDFSPGYGEDLDYCIRTKRAGYELKIICEIREDSENKRWIVDFPLTHQGQGSFENDVREKCLINSSNVLKRKYG